MNRFASESEPVVARLGPHAVHATEELSLLRRQMRRGMFRSTTSGRVPERLHVNVIMLSRELASDFRNYCDRNPRACPLIEQTAPGRASCHSAPHADLRTDLPAYRIFSRGLPTGDRDDVCDLWEPNLVTFLLGCSFGFEHALARSGIPLRHQEQGTVVPMFRTDRATVASQHFSGPLVVSMRPIPQDALGVVEKITSAQSFSHGSPVQIGDPEKLGIRDLQCPDYGDPVTIRHGDVPVFWACGVTSQAALRRAAPPRAITHVPGRMLITDLPLSFEALTSRS